MKTNGNESLGPLANVLKNMTFTHSGTSEPDPTPDSSCPRCHGVGFMRSRAVLGEPGFGRAIACDCQIGMARSAFLARLPKGMSFASFRPKPFQAKAFGLAQQFADGSLPTPWLVLQGSFGTGKTHLGVAILRAMAERNTVGAFWVVADLLDYFRAGLRDRDGVDEGMDRAVSVRESLGPLVLDDFGRHTTTEWVREELYQLVDYRMRREMPTIVTSNLPLDQLDGALGSRLGDTHRVTVCVMAGVDMRREARP